MNDFFQAKAELNGVSYEGACFSGEDFAIRSLVQVVAADLEIDLHTATGLLRNRVTVVAV